MLIDAVLEVEAGDPQIAIDFLVSNINLSKSRLKDLMNKGGVWRVTKEGVRKRLRRAMTDILVGEQIEIFYDEALLTSKYPAPELIEDMEQYSVWNKPSGLLFEGTDFGDFNSFQRYLTLYFKPNRENIWLSSLEYHGTGLMIVAHTRKAALALSDVFKASALGKSGKSVIHYRADIVGNLVADEFEELIGEELISKKTTTEPEEYILDTPIEGEPAETIVHKVRYDKRPNRSVVDIWPKTAWPTQVRLHLIDIGFPIVGDHLGDEGDGFDDLDMNIEPEGDGVDEIEDLVIRNSEGIRLRTLELKFKCPITNKSKHYSLIK